MKNIRSPGLEHRQPRKVLEGRRSSHANAAGKSSVYRSKSTPSSSCNATPPLDSQSRRATPSRLWAAHDGQPDPSSAGSGDFLSATPSDSSDSSSVNSDVSSSTTTSEAAFRDHQQNLFKKLRPSQNENNRLASQSCGNTLLKITRTSLKRRKCVLDLSGAAQETSNAETRDSINKFSGIELNTTAKLTVHVDKKTALNTKATYKHDKARNAASKEPLIGSPQVPIKVRNIPQGQALAEVQLSLKENILAEIADRAIQETREGGGAGAPMTECHTETVLNDDEPENLDRQLEITRQLMKELRKALNDGTYRDMQVYDRNGRQEESAHTKHEILWDVLLMLRRSFVDILGRFTRSYRPTGIPVADREMVSEMDNHISAREKLLCRYPNMTIAEMLESLAAVGHEADLKTLAGL